MTGTAKRLRIALATGPAWLTMLWGQAAPIRVTENALRGAARQKIEPDYPAVARQIRLTGDVELEITVDASGVVQKVAVLRGNTLLSGSSVQAVKKWRFTPFQAEGQPAPAVGPIKFSFQM